MVIRCIGLHVVIRYQAVCGNTVYRAVCGNTVYRAVSGNTVYRAACGNTVYRAVSGNTVYQAACGNTVYRAVCGNTVYQAACCLIPALVGSSPEGATTDYRGNAMFVVVITTRHHDHKYFK